MSFWEKIKSLFSRKQAQTGSVDAELDDAVESYIRAESSNFFDSLISKIKNAASKDIAIAKNDVATAKKDFEEAKSHLMAQ
jgi:hypothetical protein